MKPFALIHPYESIRNGRPVVITAERVKVGEERRRKANAYAAGTMGVSDVQALGFKYLFEIDSYNNGKEADARLTQGCGKS